MAKRKAEPWYYKYLRRYVRDIFRWSPERRKALKRAQVSKTPERYRCEECGKEPLERKDKEVDHIIPCENPTGWDGWSNFIERTIEVQAEGLKVLCKPCHYKKSAQENRLRRKKIGAMMFKIPKGTPTDRAVEMLTWEINSLWQRINQLVAQIEAIVNRKNGSL